jgi:hypothetical protein
MPWEETEPMIERIKFVLDVESGVFQFSEICETYPKSCVWTSLNHIKGHWVSHHKSERSAV